MGGKLIKMTIKLTLVIRMKGFSDRVLSIQLELSGKNLLESCFVGYSIFSATYKAMERFRRQ